MSDKYCLQHSGSAFSPLFPWASWENTSPYLPANFHLNIESILSMLTALNTWKRSAINMWRDTSVIEAYLLFIALLHRDLELLDFDFDVDTPLASRPDYFQDSLLRTKYFGMVTATLSKIAKTIPVEGEAVAAVPALAAAPPLMESISAVTPKSTRPRPRQPKRRETQNRAASPESEGKRLPNTCFPYLHCCADAGPVLLTPPDTSPAKPDESANDSSSESTPKTTKSKAGRGRGRGRPPRSRGRGRGRGSKQK